MGNTPGTSRTPEGAVPPDETFSEAPRADDDSLPSLDLPQDAGQIALPTVDAQAYALEAEHGRGGLGRVYRAHDRRLDRTVAVKELLRNDPTSRKRFLREVRITAKLQHPGIVPVHEAGRWPSGEPFYAMKLVEGRTLKEKISEAKTLQERLTLLPHIIAVAEAIAYAHSQGVIHRDLKPSNVIVGEFGETVVIDWGLAKDLSAEDDPDAPDAGPYRQHQEAVTTVAGSVLGTPAYMAPEQARGEGTDERADVYSLGAILYHVLVGKPAYEGATSRELIAHLLLSPPQPIKTRDSEIPSELVAIIECAMARSPNCRYTNAGALADDLRRFQSGRVVSAHTYSVGALVARWARRHRAAILAITGALFAAVATGGIGLSRVIAAKNDAQRQRSTALDAKRVAELRADRLILANARSELQRDPTAAVARLKTYPVDGTAWNTVRDLVAEAVSQGVAERVLSGHTGTVVSLAYRPHTEALLSTASDKTLRYWDPTTNSGTILDTRLTEISALAVSPDGTRVAYEAYDGSLRLMSLLTRQAVTLAQHKTPIWKISFSHDSRLLLTQDNNWRVRVWKLNDDSTVALIGNKASHEACFSPSGRYMAYLQAHGSSEELRIWDIAASRDYTLAKLDGVTDYINYSPNETLIAIVNTRQNVALVDMKGATKQVPLPAAASTGTGVKFSPDGRLLAAAGRDEGRVWIWNISEQQVASEYRHDAKVRSIEFSPDGEIFASTGQDGTIRIRHLETGTHYRYIHAHPVFAPIAFSSSGLYLASGASDGSIRTWLRPHHVPRVMRGHKDAIYHVEPAPDGKHIATDSRDRTIRIWDMHSGEVSVLEGHQEGVFGLRFSPDGTYLASASWDGTGRIWNLLTGTSRILKGHQGALHHIECSPDGRILATSGVDGKVNIWSRNGEHIRTLQGHADEVYRIAFARDGVSLASASGDGTIRVWSVNTGQSKVLSGHAGLVTNVTYCPNGECLLSGGTDGTVRLWNLTGEASQIIYRGAAEVRVMKVSNDGSRLALGDAKGSATLVNLKDGSVIPLRRHTAGVSSIAFSPSGRLVATADQEGTVRILDLTTNSLLEIRSHDSRVSDMVFSPDGDKLVTVGWDQTVRVWALEMSSMIPSDPASLSSFLDRRTSAILRTDDCNLREECDE